MSADGTSHLSKSLAAPPDAVQTHAIWLDGDVLACACPDCGAPMSIRLWLLVADCWRCGTSLELTEEQEREALRLLKERGHDLPAAQAPSAPRARTPPASSKRPITSAPADKKPVFKTPQPATAKAAPPSTLAPRPAATAPPPLPAGLKTSLAPARPQRRLASGRAAKVQQELKTVRELGPVELWSRAIFRDLPAWITSLVVHMVLLIVLALWAVSNEHDLNKSVTLVLSTHTSDLHRPGGRKEEPEPDPVEFEKPGEDEKIVEREEQPEPVVAPDPPQPPAEEPPGQPQGKKPHPFSDTGAAPGAGKSLFSGRKATARSELVQQEGGTSETEAAVARGLQWLAKHQNSNGSWSLDEYHKAGDCKGRCRGGGFSSDVAGTALALLPFLGAGETHLQGKYKDEVRRGLAWLLKRQEPDGDFPSPFRNSHMYAHGQAAIAVCEAYALTQDPWLRDPAQRSINFIVNAQHSQGGWRYQPGDEGDTSVVGWQIMALRSAQLAYLKVPPETLKKASRFLDAAQATSLGDRYGYMPGSGESHVMTAEALLCRQYGGWPQNHPALSAGAEWLLTQHPPTRGRELNMYYWYYATQVMHHVGGETWQRWNYQMRDLLVSLQETKGHPAGSWAPRGGHDTAGGRVYMTALAVCTLEVYYRHLPLYRAMAVEK